MATQADLVALNKQMYADQIAETYMNKGILRSLITNDTGAIGINKTFPLVGIQTTYERIGGEAIQPNQPVTSSVVMTYNTYEATAALPFIEQYKINNPSYIPTLVNRQTDSITSRIEQTIINAMNNTAVLDQNTINITNIEAGYRINGDGSAYTNTAGEQVLGNKGLMKIKEMFDDMGVADGERYLYLPSNALYGLMTGADKTEFTNSFFTGDYNLKNKGVIYNFLGINIYVAQKNPLQGLPTSGAGTYAFAFTMDTVISETATATPGSNMWIQDSLQSYIFLSNIRLGAVAVAPSRLIKIACKTA